MNDHVLISLIVQHIENDEFQAAISVFKSSPKCRQYCPPGANDHTVGKILEGRLLYLSISCGSGIDLYELAARKLRIWLDFLEMA